MKEEITKALLKVVHIDMSAEEPLLEIRNMYMFKYTVYVGNFTSSEI